MPVRVRVSAFVCVWCPFVDGIAGAGTPGSIVPLSPCPYVVSFYDAFVDSREGTLNFVMEYMDGGSLEVSVVYVGCVWGGVGGWGGGEWGRFYQPRHPFPEGGTCVSGPIVRVHRPPSAVPSLGGVCL
jgi:hypothetical protein